ncbi:MAG: DUF1080 domain-containing protein [Phycisphaerae bacterium]|nr:DUF1080 domain-containing protein [Phycisphaerae bacterium]
MKCILTLLGVVSGSLVLNVASVLAAPAVGRWNIVIGDGQPSGYCWIEILADGDKFKASFQPEAGGCHEIEPPKVEGDKVTFKAGWTYTGTVKGNTMTGERVNGNNRQKFSAKRWVPMLNVKGDWSLKVEGSTEMRTLTLGAENGKISGSLTGDKKDKIWDVKMIRGTLTFKVAESLYRMVVKGDIMEGEVTTDGKTTRLVATRTRKYGDPIELFNGKNTDGWKPLGDPKDFKWEVKKEGNDSILWTSGGANIVSEQKFGDFKLHVEFRVPQHGNSGVYLRGRYEIQVADSQGGPPSGGGSGAIYERILPSKNVCKAAGEWQTYDVTLSGQYVTLVFNGEKVIDNVEIPGMTGGAIDNNDLEPGPIYLQGDHGKIEYRKITITPAK